MNKPAPEYEITATMPGGEKLRITKDKGKFSISIDGQELELKNEVAAIALLAYLVPFVFDITMNELTGSLVLTGIKDLGIKSPSINISHDHLLKMITENFLKN